MPLYIKLEYTNYFRRFGHIFEERKKQESKKHAVILNGIMFPRSWGDILKVMRNLNSIQMSQNSCIKDANGVILNYV